MSNINDLLGGTYLSADNVQQPLLVTIVGTERIELDRQTRVSVQFEELSKPLLTNKTNLGTLAKLFGGETAQWVGLQAILQTEPVSFQGKTVNGLRVKPYQPPVQQAEPMVSPYAHEQPPADELPF